MFVFFHFLYLFSSRAIHCGHSVFGVYFTQRTVWQVLSTIKRIKKIFNFMMIDLDSKRPKVLDRSQRATHHYLRICYDFNILLRYIRLLAIGAISLVDQNGIIGLLSPLLQSKVNISPPKNLKETTPSLPACPADDSSEAKTPEPWHIRPSQL